MTSPTARWSLGISIAALVLYTPVTFSVFSGFTLIVFTVVIALLGIATLGIGQRNRRLAIGSLTAAIVIDLLARVVGAVTSPESVMYQIPLVGGIVSLLEGGWYWALADLALLLVVVVLIMVLRTKSTEAEGVDASDRSVLPASKGFRIRRVALAILVVSGLITLVFSLPALSSAGGDFGRLGGFAFVVLLTPFVFGIALALVMASLAGDIAHAKGRGWGLFFWLALLINPAIMLIIAAAISPSTGSANSAAAPAASASPTSSPEISSRLAQLTELHRNNLISDEEFATKKSELLAQL